MTFPATQKCFPASVTERWDAGTDVAKPELPAALGSRRGTQQAQGCFPSLPAFPAHTRVCAHTHTDTQKHMDAPRGRSGGSGREQSRQQAGRGAAGQRCGEMGLAWGRERNKRSLWRTSGLSLTHAGKKLIKK